MQEIKVQCPAKINLTLKIVGKRPDGFHDIESIMQTISLYDYLTIKLEPADCLEINLTGNSEEIPYDESNLVHKAAKLFFDELKAKINRYILQSCHSGFKPTEQTDTIESLVDDNASYKIDIFIDKNIPIAAGLAGGSTDAAGTIYGLNKILGEPLSNNELHTICASLGSDLNFCLEGGTQMTQGRGEILTPMEFKEQALSLIKPCKLGISAKEAYTKFAQKHSISDYNRENYVNDLEWAIIDDYIELQSIKNNYPNSVMSGSGSTYYLFNEEIKPKTGFWVKNNLTTTKSGVRIIE